MKENMNGKVCLVTGGTNGIGKATAQALAQMGATVVVVGRDAQKAAQVTMEIQAASGNQNVDWLLADLSSQQDIRRLAAEFKSTYSQLHVLINNAGGTFMTRQLSVDGIEMTFALNHLAYFLVTNLLLDTIKASLRHGSSMFLLMLTQAEKSISITFRANDPTQASDPMGIPSWRIFCLPLNWLVA